MRGLTGLLDQSQPLSSIVFHAQASGLVDISPVVMHRNGRIQKPTFHLALFFKRCLEISPSTKPSNIKNPWLDVGAAKETCALAEPALALTAVGMPGTVRGVTAFDGADATPVPTLLVAVTLKV